MTRLGVGNEPAQPKKAFKLAGRQLALAALAVSALAALLWYFYLYTPAQANVALIESENQLLETENMQGRAARANLPALRAEVAGLRAERDSFLAQLPERSEVAELLDQLRAAARDARVSFTGLQNAGPGSDVVPGVRLLNFTLGTEGSYDRTINFLRALEALPRFTRVERVGLNVGTEAQADPSLAASYDFTVYIYTGVEPVVDPALDPSLDPNADPSADPATDPAAGTS